MNHTLRPCRKVADSTQGKTALVGTPRGRLGQLEQDFLAKPWAQVRDEGHVKLGEQGGNPYILASSGARRHKEQAVRWRQLKKLIKRLHEPRQQKLTSDQLLVSLGADPPACGSDLGGLEHDKAIACEVLGRGFR